MISSQILQNTIEGLKTITKVDLCIMDTEWLLAVMVMATTQLDVELKAEVAVMVMH